MNSTNHQLIVSPELLMLLEWLIENEQEGLKKLVAKALKQIPHLNQPKKAEDMQHAVVDFLSLLDTVLAQAHYEQELNAAHHATIFPTAKHIDSSVCDTETISSLIAKATKTLELDTQANAKEVLCKELLKRWKPNKQSQHN